MQTSMGDQTAVVKDADMSEEMQQYAVELAILAIEKYNEFEKKYNPTWHCIVGRKFGSCVSHETKHFIFPCAWKTNGGYSKPSAGVEGSPFARWLAPSDLEFRTALAGVWSLEDKLSVLRVFPVTKVSADSSFLIEKLRSCFPGFTQSFLPSWR
ncbi:hypothetical protein QYF61_019057 [Mycteria americana]|uniref:Dynein light chain n=1 Tax=Mycteria americana TaxID=33587 RepID=A0AAN7MU08_MYCAM|nr:hypothetical protein QYF61_019057 [Mycteria americana]